MRRVLVLFGPVALALAACEEVGGPGAGGFINPLPEEVVSLAAPNQNLDAVRIDPIDGCLVYQYEGPVETTFLPLRSKTGRPICTRTPAETQPGPAPSS